LTEIDIRTQYQNSVSEHADVCIIGSGAGGSVLAYELSKQDKKIIMLEQGGYYDIDYIEQQTKEEELLKLWKHSGVFLSRNFSVNVAQGQCIGGSTMINYGICFRMPDYVFDTWKNEHGIAITNEELKDAYEKVEDQYSVKPITNAGRSHELLKKGCEVLGYSSDWMDKAMVGDRKQNVLVAYLEKSKKENLTIFANCKAEYVVKNSGKISTIKATAIDLQTNEKHSVEVTADKIILSAGPIASSEFLLKNKIANKSGKVGKYLSVHPASSVVGLFDEKINGERGMVMAYYCDKFSARKIPDRGFMIESVFVAPSGFSLIMPSFGLKNMEYVKKYDNVAMAGVLVHDEPVGKISLNQNEDAVLDYTLTKGDQKRMVDGIRETVRIYLKAGAKQVITGHIEPTIIHNESEISKITDDSAGMGKLLVASAHPQGGNRMGKNANNSVVNSYCKSYDIPNLYVCDASVFPTAVGVNPQLTVLAISTIASQHIYDGD